MKNKNKQKDNKKLIIILIAIVVLVILFWNNIFSGQIIKGLFLDKEITLTAEEKQEVALAVRESKLNGGHNIKPKYEIFEEDKGNLPKTEAVLNELLSKDRDCIRDVNIATYMNRDYPEIVDKLCENINYECCEKVIGAERCTQDYINEFKEDCRAEQFARYIW